MAAPNNGPPVTAANYVVGHPPQTTCRRGIRDRPTAPHHLWARSTEGRAAVDNAIQTGQEAGTIPVWVSSADPGRLKCVNDIRLTCFEALGKEEKDRWMSYALDEYNSRRRVRHAIGGGELTHGAHQ